jgi:tetratricopeptide (TPR) repeat protein
MAKPFYSGPPLSRLLQAQNIRRPESKAKPKSHKSAPHDIAVMLQHGIELQTKGSLGMAAEAYQRILEVEPNNPDALHLLGTVAMAGGEVDAALSYFKRAVAAKPNDPSIRVNLGIALFEKGEPAEAEFHLRKALKLHSNLPAALCLLADCRMEQGDSAEAKRIYESVLSGTPDAPQVLVRYADLCQKVGEIEAARSGYRRAISLTEKPAMALAGLATCEKLTKDSPESVAILRYLRTPGLRPLEYLHLSYAAANIAEAADDYDEAFAHFLRAKEISPARFDIEALQGELTTYKRLFTKEFFEARAKHGHPSTRPVFIVGMPRSGTTLTEQIISRHPRAAPADELRDIGRIGQWLSKDGGVRVYAKRLAQLGVSETKELASRYLAALDRVSTEADRITDKMPQNFFQLGLIALLFPKARIIHCRRDPLDTCLSCFTMQLKDHNHGYAGDLKMLGLYYREYHSLMAHWREVLPVPIYDLDYERLVEAPEEESRKLIEFIGLPWDEACLSPQESQRAVKTLSRLQVRQPIYRTSVQRWRRYEKHLGPLKAALGDLFTDTGDTASSPV